MFPVLPQTGRATRMQPETRAGEPKRPGTRQEPRPERTEQQMVPQPGKMEMQTEEMEAQMGRLPAGMEARVRLLPERAMRRAEAAFPMARGKTAFGRIPAGIMCVP